MFVVRRERGAIVFGTSMVGPTVDANAVAGLQDSAFGAVVHVDNDVPVIVERSMYWGPNGSFEGGTNAVGIPFGDRLEPRP